MKLVRHLIEGEKILCKAEFIRTTWSSYLVIFAFFVGTVAFSPVAAVLISMLWLLLVYVVALERRGREFVVYR